MPRKSNDAFDARTAGVSLRHTQMDDRIGQPPRASTIATPDEIDAEFMCSFDIQCQRLDHHHQTCTRSSSEMSECGDQVGYPQFYQAKRPQVFLELRFKLTRFVVKNSRSN
ncbi:hypothetical protein Ae201684_007612 [Aphanomyces euteiches]|uniref:Uncharacterized protein n=1 Tax=Aphanomyces euteiches TaxID=100861 RepID=A0A6G0X7U9_9STRA|nr:hypothetical protein Ae201684_007612 [Aphanomyces euteiches]